MNKEYIEISYQFNDQEQFDMLVAQLSFLGFEGFNEEGNICKAYLLSSNLEDENVINELNNIFKKHSLNYSKSIIKEENWNAVWESNFDPVRVGHFVGIRAHFHSHFEPAVQHEIMITPKMSFGTGHHATTYSVIQMMEQIDFNGKQVYDFGTGTGILAILAEKLGASKVLAVDNDPWCIENASENIENNAMKRIKIEKVESAYVENLFEVILANVNRQIIEDNIAALTQVAHPNGAKLVLSGLLIEDQLDMIELAKINGWVYEKNITLNGWISLLFSR